MYSQSQRIDEAFKASCHQQTSRWVSYSQPQYLVDIMICLLLDVKGRSIADLRAIKPKILEKKFTAPNKQWPRYMSIFNVYYFTIYSNLCSFFLRSVCIVSLFADREINTVLFSQSNPKRMYEILKMY